jgi:integrase/recombinase XerD
LDFLRHTFAVYKLIQWYKEGVDLSAKLPLLVTYLGDENFKGTQKCLHLMAELFPELTLRMNSEFGDVIPRRVQE